MSYGINNWYFLPILIDIIIAVLLGITNFLIRNLFCHIPLNLIVYDSVQISSLWGSWQVLMFVLIVVFRTVSWVRYRDIHLLTHGVQSYTDDKRFSAYMDIDTNTWQLRIKNVSSRWDFLKSDFSIFLV